MMLVVMMLVVMTMLMMVVATTNAEQARSLVQPPAVTLRSHLQVMLHLQLQVIRKAATLHSQRSSSIWTSPFPFGSMVCSTAQQILLLLLLLLVLLLHNSSIAQQIQPQHMTCGSAHPLCLSWAGSPRAICTRCRLPSTSCPCSSQC